jgi:hypothetical protein
MLFLYRPRQTWMPFSLPRNRTDQAAYNRQLQDRFASTCRVPPAVPASTAQNPVEALQELAVLHRSGDLTDAEFHVAKSKLLTP